MDPDKLLLPSRRGVAFPAIFQLVKAVVRANVLSDDMRTVLKGWLKSKNTLLALLSLTVCAWAHACGLGICMVCA